MKEGHTVLGEKTSTNTHILLSILVLVLATPTLNPVLGLCDVFDVPPSYLTTAAVLFLLHTISSDIQQVAFYSVRIFFHSILSIFFRNIEVVGADNIPANGPVIFTGNHSNQFVDGLMVLCHARHRLGFLIAQASWDKPVIGDLAKLAGCIPVMRPQDSAKKGTGKALFDGTLTVRGVDTQFKSEFAAGDKIRPRDRPEQLKIEEVVSDTELRLSSVSQESVPDFTKKGPSEQTSESLDEDPATPPSESSTPQPEQEEEGEHDPYMAFDCLARVDQAQVFSKVIESLKAGRSLGIFPEGGSHDQTDLLPLKPGVAIIAMEAYQKHRLAVPIVPVGLSYFDGHKFRGRCVIEFGPPILIPQELGLQYQSDKKAATNTFLDQIEEGLRGCLVTAPTYDELELVYMVRRLYTRDGRLTATQKQDLNRRFAFWYSNFYLKKKSANEVPVDLEELYQRVINYRDSLKLLGLRDYQVRHLTKISFSKVMGTLVHLLYVFVMAMFPMLFLNLPVGIFARLVAEKHRKEALAKSNVKLTAKDVTLSKMISVCIVGVPALWLSYAVVGLLLGFRVKAVLLMLFCFPFFSYLGVVAAESGMVDLKDLRPLMLRLWVNRESMLRIMKMREGLQKEVRSLVRKYGPEIGDIYTAQKIKWGSLPKGFSEVNLAALQKEPPASSSTS